MMKQRRRKQSAENRRRERAYERDRALQALRNAAFILIAGFLALGLAFANAWNQ